MSPALSWTFLALLLAAVTCYLLDNTDRRNEP